jgi:parallel beta-helix repeat protein
LYVGGSGEGNYTTIQDAIDNANHGDTVFVYDDVSPYSENLVVKKPITIIGENKQTTIINGSFKLKTNRIKIAEFTIQSTGKCIHITSMSDSNIIEKNILNSSAGIGIRVDISNFNIISDNVINAYNGIVLDGDYYHTQCNQNKIDNNTITSSINNSGIGILLKTLFNIMPAYWGQCKDNNISCNIISKYEKGICFDFCQENDIFGNEIYGNQEGIEIDSCHPLKNIIISGNMISNNHRGINSYVPSDEKFIIISGNTIFNNQVGIYGNVKEISGNIISNNSKGIWYKLGDSVIINNQFDNNLLGLYLDIPFDCIISKNNFIDNIKHTDFRLSLFYPFQKWSGNYWNESRSSPKLIFGKIGPFRLIPWINFDWHPAKEPYDIEVVI